MSPLPEHFTLHKNSTTEIRLMQKEKCLPVTIANKIRALVQSYHNLIFISVFQFSFQFMLLSLTTYKTIPLGTCYCHMSLIKC